MYSIDVSVNGFTGRGTALEYLHRRAYELCPTGFEIVDRESGSDVSFIRTSDSTVQQVNKPNVSAIIRCTLPPSPAPAVAPPPPPAAKGWACSLLQVGEGGACFPDMATCNEVRLAVAKEGVGTTDCFISRAVYCYTGNTAKLCFPTQGICDRERVREAEANPERLAPSACHQE